MFRILSPFKTKVVGVSLSLIVSGFLVLSLGIACRKMVDDSLSYGTLIFFFIAFTILLAGSSFIRVYSVNAVIGRATQNLKTRIFAHLLTWEVADHDAHKPSELLSRITTDVDVIHEFLAVSLPVFIRNGVLFLGGVVGMALISWTLALKSFLFIPLMIVPVLFFSKNLREVSKKMSVLEDKISKFAFQVLGHIKNTFAFSHQLIDIERFYRLGEESRCLSQNHKLLRACLSCGVMMLVMLFLGILIWIGIQDVAKHEITKGDLTSFMIYLAIMGVSSSSFGELYAGYQRAQNAFDRIYTILRITHTEEAKPRRVLPVPSYGIVAFHNVSFSYPSQNFILDRITLSVLGGETLAIVGPSGAGKSTFLHLLLRFYDPASGAIHVDGVNIKDASKEDLRKRIGFVPQSPTLFPGTLYENLTYGTSGVSSQKVQALFEPLLDFASRLPQGIQTPIEPHQLSGGQVQRIAFVRALLKKPSILVLDEPTNALDRENETLIQKMIDKTLCTTIVVTHRLSTILRAQRIVVLDQGKILSTGSHAELVSTCPLYQKLSQAS